MSRALLVALVFILGLIIVARMNYSVPTPTPSSSPLPSVSESPQGDILVQSPTTGGLVESPVTVTGMARGNWFFEASFSAKILDAQGNTLGEGVMQAQDDWMTTNMVPYKGEITFSPPTTKTGTLVLSKANPSGLDENAKSYTVPISFD